MLDGQAPQHPQSLINPDTLTAMAEDIVNICNEWEKIGLVDYEMGIEEESIIICQYPSFDYTLPPY